MIKYFFISIICYRKEKITIDKFRDRQKEIEEMNKKKRAMLTSAISEKYTS